MTLEEFKKEQFEKNPEVKAEYDRLGPQYEELSRQIRESQKEGCDE